MDRVLLSRIDEDLDSSEVAELCFLCSDIINRKRLEGIKDAKELFMRMEEKGLLENSSFLSQLLYTIHRADLLNMLENDSRQTEETDANPFLSEYRLLLYKIHEDLTQENLDKLKFLLKDKLPKRPLELSSTALNVFSEMEKAGLISNRNVRELHVLLLEFDRQLAMTVENYMNNTTPPVSSSQERSNGIPHVLQPSLSMCETQPAQYVDVCSDTQSQITLPLSDETEYYVFTKNPRGLCVIINNETFSGKLGRREGTDSDQNALDSLFDSFGFTVKSHKNLTAEEILKKIKELSDRDFSTEDAFVLCVLSHGGNGFVYGTDEKEVKLEQLTEPFSNMKAPTLLGKPKLFFIQACQGAKGQDPVCQCTKPGELPKMTSRLSIEADCAPENTVASGADMLLGMATVPNHKCYRHTRNGSLYIQELCKQLKKAAESPNNDDIHTVLTRVNREVSKNYTPPSRQMPEPKYTLTKRLVLRFI
ncbi:caspase-8-like [Cyprinodon tularosa]|uniref:caspase-8-like n=1 Tax=Cyprinodon tularosa TaxID=77115 RepID=UPI0018E23229|nr:caspase-8-like [Cyprinodon tularosa]XP_038134765.1 caspase-8-like [Cyprinodon tularosa]